MECEGRGETRQWRDAATRADAVECDMVEPYANVGASRAGQHSDGQSKRWCWAKMATQCLAGGEKSENRGGEREMIGGEAPILYWCIVEQSITMAGASNWPRGSFSQWLLSHLQVN